MGQSEEIGAHGGEDVEENAGFDAARAVEDIRGEGEGIAFADGDVLAVHGEDEFAGEDARGLGVQVRMGRADAAGFEVHFDDHDVVGMGEDAAGDAAAEVAQGCVRGAAIGCGQGGYS